MEDCYIFHSDIVQELASLFGPEILIEMSTSHKIFRLFIFELKYCNQRFYYRDVYKFHKLQSIYLPKFHDFSDFNPNRYSQIKFLKCYNHDNISHIMLLTNLRNCFVESNFHHYYPEYFHSNLISMYHVAFYCQPFVSILNKYTNMTSLQYHGQWRETNEHDFYELKTINHLNNIKSLYINQIENIYDIWKLTILNQLEILTLNDFETFDGHRTILFRNFNVTQLDIFYTGSEHFDKCVLDNCTRLKSITLHRCDDFTINYMNNIRTLIIYESRNNFMKNLEFDLNIYTNLKYFVFHSRKESNRLFTLSNLSKLQYVDLTNVAFDGNIGITKLQLKDEGWNRTYELELISFENLRYLQICSIDIINLNKLTKLENLYVNNVSKNIFDDLHSCVHLTSLELTQCKITNLSTLTNLFYLSIRSHRNKIYNSKDIADICDQLNNLIKLTKLVLNFDISKKKKILFDCNLLSRCINLKSFQTNMRLNHFFHLTKLHTLNLDGSSWKNYYNSTLSLLTRLTYIETYIGKKNRIVNIINLTRLEHRQMPCIEIKDDEPQITLPTRLISKNKN